MAGVYAIVAALSRSDKDQSRVRYKSSHGCTWIPGVLGTRRRSEVHGEIPRFTVVVRLFGSPEFGEVGNRVGRTPPVQESAAVRSLREIQRSSRGLRHSPLGELASFSQRGKLRQNG